MSEEIANINDVLNEYFRLKEKFEHQNMLNKKKIINNITLSKREKRAEYLKLMPKCVNCKRPSRKGTIFTNTFTPSTDNTDAFRILKASCGVLADPCNLNIQINLGQYELLDEMITNIRNEIIEYKNKIINDKNKLLFGLITTETAISNFEENKDYVNNLTSIYEQYLETWNETVENPQKKVEMNETQVLIYENINGIKECIKKMNETNNVQFAGDAANIYHNVLMPLLIKNRQLKYSENKVFSDDISNTCRLIQKKYTPNDILFSGYASKVVSYDVGLKAKSKKDAKKKPLLIIESDSEEPQNIKNLSKKIQLIPGTIDDEPIIGKGEDGIDWNEPEYKNLWSKLPVKLKAAFKLNIDWMKEFMNKCVNERINSPPGFNGCKLTTPPNIVIPPRIMENGQYDFGVSIYNEAFNKLPETLKKMYLTFYKEDPETKQKNYKMLEDQLNSLVEKEVGFGRGFF